MKVPMEVKCSFRVSIDKKEQVQRAIDTLEGLLDATLFFCDDSGNKVFNIRDERHNIVGCMCYNVILFPEKVNK